MSKLRIPEKSFPSQKSPTPYQILIDKSYEYKSKDFKEFPYELKSGRLKDDANFGYLDLRTFGICKTGDDDDDKIKK